MTGKTFRTANGKRLRVIESMACNDAPRMLRQLAKEVTAGMPELQQIVLVLDTGKNVEVRGFGPMDGIHAIGLLQLGIQRLAGDTIKTLDEQE